VITGELKSRIDRVWDAFWSGGISNPLEVIEQITYLLFVRRLDDLQTAKERVATRMLRLTPEAHAQLVDHLADLPTSFRDDDTSEEAKRFDLLALRLQIALINADPGYSRMRAQVQEIASARSISSPFPPCARSTNCSTNSPATSGGKTSPCRCWKPCAAASAVWSN